MKEKLLWAAVAIIAGAALTSHAQQPLAASGAPRFQLIAAERNLNGVKTAVVLRFDTQTGQTSMLREGDIPNIGASKKTYRFQYWQLVDDRFTPVDDSDEARQATILRGDR